MAKRLILKTAGVVLVMALIVSAPLRAQETKWEITPSADLVSSYVWRGLYQTATAFQPGLSISFAGLSLAAWGSTDFAAFAKEVDFTLGYEVGGFSVAVTDYWWQGEGEKYGYYSATHHFEGTVGFSFGESFPLSLGWNTMVWEADGGLEGYEQNYSTYISAAYDFSVKDVAVTVGIGVSPWEGYYTDGLAVSTLSLRATKEVKLSDSFSLPVFAETIIAPNQDNVFLVFGISF